MPTLTSITLGCGCEAEAVMAGKKPYFRIPHQAYVLVGDGRKAMVLRNEGSEVALRLKVEQVFQQQNPPTREQGSDRPGRTISNVDGRRSAMAEPDRHDIEEQRFAKDVAAALESILRQETIAGLVVVAPPRTLATLRQSFAPEIAKHIIAEIDKDLAGLPVPEIEKHLTS